MRNEDIENSIVKSFRAEPNYHLPADFARRVTFAVERQVQWKNDLLEYLYLSIIVAALVSISIGLYYYIDKTMVMKFYSFISGNVIQVVSVILILNFILFADKVLLPFLFNRWNRI